MKIRSKQQGFALLIFVALLATAAAALAVKVLSNQSGSNNQIARDKITAAALAQAKDALIGYAITYGDSHSGQLPGYLPLPDLGTSRNNNVTPQEGYVAANFSGNSKNLTVIGRLPWLTLDLPPLRDGQGECLWYAVSGSFQNTKMADVLNWDSLGHFDAYSSNGTSSGTVSMAGVNYAQRPVAIIFSASAVLQGQNRNVSATDTVSTCGGNYNVQNYLDSFNSDVNIDNIVNYFAGSNNNSIGYAYNLSNISNGSQLSAADLLAPKNIIFGDTAVSGIKIVNDRILIVTADDIFRQIIKRNDFKNQITALLNDVVFIPYLKTLDLTLPGTGTKGTGNIDCDNSLPGNKNFCTNWKEMLLLTQLSTPAPITIDGAATSNCSRVLIFGGQKTGAQVRLTTADKTAPLNYLEAPNLAAFAVPTTPSSSFSGTTTFNANNPGQDLLRCL